MTFSNEEADQGSSATHHFAVDGYRQDETLTLTQRQTPEGSSTGLRISDGPERSIHDVGAGLDLEAPVSRAEQNSRIEELRDAGREDELQALFGTQRVFLGLGTDIGARLILEDGQLRPWIENGRLSVGAKVIVAISNLKPCC